VSEDLLIDPRQPEAVLEAVRALLREEQRAPSRWWLGGLGVDASFSELDLPAQDATGRPRSTRGAERA